MFRKSLLIIFIVIASASAFLKLRSEPIEPTSLIGETGDAQKFIGEIARARTHNSIKFTVPPHPFMAAQGRNTMHADSYSSDVHPYPGPLGNNIQMSTRAGLTTTPGGQCATLTVSAEQNIVVLCAGITGFRIHLLEHRSLRLLAEYRLPIRPSTYDSIIHRDKRFVMEDSSGAYFYLDREDRFIIAASDQTIRAVEHKMTSAGYVFIETHRWDLSEQVPHDCTTLTNWEPKGECDPITAVLPDHNGLIWFVSRYGRYGTLSPTSGQVEVKQLTNEEIQNGFSVADDGVYIASDHALYRFEADDAGRPLLHWREAYDRGSSRKIGSINQGTGTTPTLIGDDYVTIADNADGQINLLVYKRKAQTPELRKICKVPLFRSGHSATENSMIGVGRSVVIENNAGYTSVYADTDWNSAAGGMSRIDIREDESGCDVIWDSPERITSVVPKLSAKNGLVYVYTFEKQDNNQIAWYFTALDFESGKTQFKYLTGIGSVFDNNWCPISLTPDGTAYIGTSKGLIAIWDKP